MASKNVLSTGTGILINDKRHNGVSCYNFGSDTIYLRWDGGKTVKAGPANDPDAGIPLLVGGFLDIPGSEDKGVILPIYAIAGSGTQDLRFMPR